MNALAFTSPLMLTALLALPVIWWLLRITPPRPEREAFPPLAILAGIVRREESAATSPWWLTLLRIILAALIILALSGPVLNPDSGTVSGRGPLVLVIDNGWSSAPDWPARLSTARRLVDKAADLDVTVHVIPTSSPRTDAAALSADEALKRLEALRPEPQKTDRARALSALEQALAGVAPGTIAWIADGMAEADTDETLARLARLGASDVMLLSAEAPDVRAILSVANGADAMEAGIARLSTAGAETVSVSALDSKGRIIATATAEFASGAAEAKAVIETPFELRNDVARLEIDGLRTAGAVRLVDDTARRRRVALLTGETGDRSQPLLSPLYYIERALGPFANLTRPQSNDLAVALPALLSENPSAIIMADIGRLPPAVETALADWISKGGTLIRFAGPRLATASADDPLIPVRLRQGERFLGGALSWSEPQAMAAHPEISPFFGLAIPTDIRISRQVLAEPSAELAAASWAVLEDGTPLVTARRDGAGRIVLFHVSADAGWSNLPLSGHFVEMLRRVVQLSRTSGAAARSDGEAALLPPWRLMSADGRLTSETAGARPLALDPGADPEASFDNPPGLYGNEDGFVALNLLDATDKLRPLDTAATPVPLIRGGLAGSQATELAPSLFLAAVLILIADTAIVLLMAGIRPRRRAGPATALVLFALAALAIAPGTGLADDTRPGDDTLMARLDTTHLAYVITGETEVDTLSERGLAGLSDYLYYRTTLEPGAPVGVDIETDELSVFPILYWPISATAPMPSEAAVSRIAAYMRSGGTVLFDTRDQLSSMSLDGSASPNTVRLQDILAAIDIPPLEPVPSDHVLTKAFYLLKTFPGRYAGSPLWVEALPERGANEAERPARSGDGVTPIMITGNDFAGAWAMDKSGNPLLPVVPGDNDQREYAYRSGVNIMMYMLTGNYKADQVHVPALLERLGQ